MTIELLIATINQTDYALINRLNVKTNCIICNQNDEKTSYKIFNYDNNIIRWYDFQEKGVGLNRNNALMRSTADICLIGDDDVKYLDDYNEVIIDAFVNNPTADVILFNIFSNSDRFVCKRKMRVNKLNCGKFGGVRIAFKRMSVIKNAISFNLLFGGGAMFSAGEDNMFIRDCIRKGLKVIAVPDYILELEEESDSTWFNGYNDKFFCDLGTSYCVHFGVMARIFVIIQLIRKKSIWLQQRSFFSALSCANKGIKLYKQL